MKTHTRNIEGIEALRGVAALMVLFYHLVELLKVPLPGSLDFIRSHFGLGVPLFYALSGFVLAYGYSATLTTPNEVRTFYIRRLFRIAPLFYFMLAAWIVVNWSVWGVKPSLLALLLNVTFSFGLVPGMHESMVWAGWSIGIEMLFYLVFPVIAFLTSSIRSTVIVLVLVCIVSGAAYGALSAVKLGSFAYMNVVTHLPNFICGVLVYRVWERTGFRVSPWGSLFFIAAIILSFLLIREPQIYIALAGLHFAFLERNIWIFVFGFLIFSTCVWRNPLLLRGPLKNIGRLSFSMYLVHPMLMLGLMQLDVVGYLKSHITIHLVAILAGAVMTLGLVWIVSYITYRFIEAPGITMGKRLSQKTGQNFRAPTTETDVIGLTKDQYVR